jgi:hypothetical protein
MSKRGSIVAAVAFALVALASGCDRGPSCAETAEHMVTLANAEVEVEVDEEVTDPEARERLRLACEGARWSAETRRCLLAAGDQEAATACMRERSN